MIMAAAVMDMKVMGIAFFDRRFYYTKLLFQNNLEHDFISEIISSL